MTSWLTTMLALTTTSLSFTAFTANALETYNIKDYAGNAFVQMRVFGLNDGIYSPAEGGITSTWDLQKPQIDQILGAIRYWGDIIKVVPGNNPAIINIGTYDDEGASAFSPTSVNQTGTGTLVHAAITSGKLGDPLYGAHGFMDVGKMDWEKAPFTPSQLPLTPKVDLTSVLIHEAAHTLGVSAETEMHTFPDEQSKGNRLGIFFSPILDVWSSHLRDENGKAAAPNQYIWCKICDAPPTGIDVFDARNDQAYFAGEHVDSVLAGAMPGIRLRTGADLYNGNDMPVFSHIELKNSTMSHQNYRNYTALMEAELAMMQDIGYTIDRRNFFGFSVYNDGLNLINDHPFFARNAAGTDYIPNSFNKSMLGLGLHVYGSDNTIYQRADLLSAGAGGGGIRVDGIGNNLTILPGTRIYINGANGRGIMFAYGKNHSLTQRGDVEALGDHGIAVSFDFGHNSLGDKNEYRGSYFVDLRENIKRVFPVYYANAMDDVSGPLVNSFDLSGRIAGRYAAIYMSPSGFADQINVMQGASISGDIISEYERKDENDALRITDLTFGRKADSNGHASELADPDFKLAYDGNITGKNLSLKIDGGTTELSGNHQLYDVAVAQPATLSGKGSYQINAEQQFHNAGLVNPSVPGSAITIDGNYNQSESGTLQLAFNENKVPSQFIVNGNAKLGGAIAFAPIKGWYPNDFSITSDKWLTATNVNGVFDKITLPHVSPTLTTKAISNGDNSYTVSLTRSANAYAQYGKNENSKAVGHALVKDTEYTGQAPQNMITALDFSPADGSAVRAALPQLSAEPYASATGVLVNASAATRNAVNNRLLQVFGGTAVTPVLEIGFAPATKIHASANAQKSVLANALARAPIPASVTAINSAAPHMVNKDDLARYAAWGSPFGSWSRQSGDRNAARTKSTLGGFTTGIDAEVYDNWRLGIMAAYSRSTFKNPDRGASGNSDNYTIGTYTGTEWTAPGGAIGLRAGLSYSWHNIEMNRSVVFDGFNDSISADYDAGTFQAFGELGYKINVAQRSILEPYANLAYVHMHTDAFSEKSRNGAALFVHSGSMDTTLSTLGLRVSTGFNLGERAATARVDLGWRHAYGDVTPTSTASFAKGSNPFTSVGNTIGRDTALIEAGFDVQLNRSTTLGLAYQGQYGSGVKQNGVNANLRVAF